MKFLIAWGVLTEVLIYFCLGFTTVAVLSYVDDGAVDMSKAVIVGGFFGIFQFARFAYDAWRDLRDLRADRKGRVNG